MNLKRRILYQAPYHVVIIIDEDRNPLFFPLFLVNLEFAISDILLHILTIDEEFIRDEEQGLDSSTDELEKLDLEFSDSPKSTEIEKSSRMKKEDRKLRSLSGRIVNYQGKNLRIHIPLTNPTRTFSSLSYLLWGDLVNQSSKKCGPDGNKLHINKKRLHHAEKMIRGAFVELYKGLGYLKTYRYICHSFIYMFDFFFFFS